MEIGFRRPDLSNTLAACTNALTRPAQSTELTFCRPEPSDAAGIRSLVERCKPLDPNSTYAYLLLCHHFGATCMLAKAGRRIVGFVSAYCPPGDPRVLFIWQVAVDPEARGAGLGTEMMQRLLARAALKGVRYLETTVSPSNHASRRMFQGFAQRSGVPLRERVLFGRDCFADEDHEEEILFRIGPLQV